MQQDHITEEKLEQFSLETLAVGDAEKVEEHFLLCPLCQERLDQADAYVHAMRAAIRTTRTNRLRRRDGSHPILPVAFAQPEL